VGKACSVQLEAALPVADRSQMTEKPVGGSLGFDFRSRFRYLTSAPSEHSSSWARPATC